MTYQQEAIEAGATHYGAKGHGWRLCPVNQCWQVYKLGAGWEYANPETKPTPLVMQFKPTTGLWERVMQCMKLHEQAPTEVSLFDLRCAINRYDAEVCE